MILFLDKDLASLVDVCSRSHSALVPRFVRTASGSHTDDSVKCDQGESNVISVRLRRELEPPCRAHNCASSTGGECD